MTRAGVPRRVIGCKRIQTVGSSWDLGRSREAWPDKRTAVSRGPCGWLGLLFLSAPKVGLPAVLSENSMKSIGARMAPAIRPGSRAR